MKKEENFNNGFETWRDTHTYKCVRVRVCARARTRTHTHTHNTPAIFLATVVVNMARPMHCVSASALMQKSICTRACVCVNEKERGRKRVRVCRGLGEGGRGREGGREGGRASER